MQLQPLLLAGLGAVVAAAPSPVLLISSPVLSPQQACDDIPALPVLRSLGDAAAAALCSQLAPVQTQTAKTTTTLSETATVTASTLAQTTETTVVDGPTDLSTETITETAIVTEPATSTAYTTPVVTVTTVGRTGPYRKKKRGDKCVVKPKPSYSVSTGYSSSTGHSASMTSSASTSPASSAPAAALEHFSRDVIAAACACLITGPAPTTTETITVTATVATESATVTTGTETMAATSTAPGLTSVFTTATTAATETRTVVTATVTVDAPATTATVKSDWPLVDFYSFRCEPIKMLSSDAADPGNPPSFDGRFRSCVARCESDPRCGQIFFSYDYADEAGGLCLTGGHPGNEEEASFTWQGSDFSCYGSSPVNGFWYNRPT
ncbi:hypothetical protein PG984_005554 [Apiospora sp. TS-2023a]